MTVIMMNPNVTMNPNNNLPKNASVKGVSSFKTLLQQHDVHIPAKELGMSTGNVNSEIEETHPNLNEEVNELFSQMPLEDGFLDMDMLLQEDVAMLLSQLPQPIQAEIKSLFQRGVSVEELLLTTGAKSVLLLSLVALEKNGRIPADYDKEQLITSLANELQVLKKSSSSFEELLQVYTKGIQKDNSSAPMTITVSELLKKMNMILENDEAPFIRLKELLTQMDGLKKQESLPFEKAIDKISEVLVKKILETNDSKLLSVLGNKDLVEAVEGKLESYYLNQKTVSNPLQAPISRIEQYVIHVTQSGSNQEIQQDFIKQFQSILKKNSTLQHSNGTREMVIKLNPEHLGSLTVKLSQGLNGEMIAKIIASSSKSKELLESNLYQLKGILQAQQPGEKVEVNIEQAPYEQQSNGREKQEREDNRANQDDEDDVKSFSQSFEEELLNLTI